MENEFLHLWRLVTDLTEQLAHNRAITASLQAQAGSIKSAASHQGTGFPLRRFNLHLSQENFETELEKMNANFVQQNADLQNDNKQLAALLKEYEQTLENVMGKFRTHAHAAQQHELTLTRHYESLLISRETSILAADLAASTAYSQSLARMSQLLRDALRACNGESTKDETPDNMPNEDHEQADYVEGAGGDDWALQRQIELERLQIENRELRRMLGLLPPPTPESSPLRFQRMLETEQRQSGNVEMTDDLALRRQPSHPLQAPLESHPHTQPLQIAFPTDAPLVTRKYGRRVGNGSAGGGGSFIGGGPSFGGGVPWPEPNTNINSAPTPFGPFRPPPVSGPITWPDNAMLGPGERNLNLQGPVQDRDINLPVGNMGEGQQGSTWDGLTAMYLRGVGWRPPQRDT